MKNTVLLSELELNQTATVEQIRCSRSLINRIFDYGIIRGARITPLYKSPFGDPTAYLVKNAVIALRNSDAEKISVSVLSADKKVDLHE